MINISAIRLDRCYITVVRIDLEGHEPYFIHCGTSDSRNDALRAGNEIITRIYRKYLTLETIMDLSPDTLMQVL